MGLTSPKKRKRGWYAKAKIIYIIHDEYLQPLDTIDLERFADKLRAEGFIPLLARDFRPHGKHRVSNAITACDFTVILAFTDSMMHDAKELGVPFVEIEDFKRLVKT